MTSLDFFKAENRRFKLKVRGDLMSDYRKKGFVVISSPPVKGDTNRFVGTVKFVFKDSEIESKIFI